MTDRVYLLGFLVVVVALLLIFLRARPPIEDTGQTGPHTCLRCNGKKDVPTPDGKGSMKCPVCRGYGEIALAQVFTYRHYESCRVCQGTGHVIGPEHRFPDGTGRPGSRVLMAKCPVETCDWGWIVTEGKVGFARIVPYLDDPPSSTT